MRERYPAAMVAESTLPTGPPAGNRRPLASRDWRFVRAAARALARAGVRPNAISVAGMLACVAAGGALAWTSRVDAAGVGERALLLLAAGLIQARLFCNVVDGLVAVEGGMRSAVGELYNEVPDRVSDVAALVGAGYAAGSSPALGWLAACLSLFVTYIRAVGKGEGLTPDYRGPMAKQHRMALLTAVCAYLALAPGAWRPRIDAGDPAPAGLMAVALAVICAGCLVTGWRRLGAVAGGMRARG